SSAEPDASRPARWGFMPSSVVRSFVITEPWLVRVWLRRRGLGQPGLAGGPGLDVVFGQATERAGRLDPDPDCGRGEIGQRDLLHLYDPHRPGVRPGGHGALAGLVARFVQRR